MDFLRSFFDEKKKVKIMNRRKFLKNFAAITIGCSTSSSLIADSLSSLFSNNSTSVKFTVKQNNKQKPNIILCMADDMGRGDTGYYGHPTLKTPNLDAMSQSNVLRFDRWYASSPVCSPTRGSCITGRHPYRYGVFQQDGVMRQAEITLAEALKPIGYRTAHFGKWHLGALTTEIDDGNLGGPGAGAKFSPPWNYGFDVCFSTESKVPTYNPMYEEGTTNPFGTKYWTGLDTFIPIDDPRVQGSDAKILMDQALQFISSSAEQKKPFFALIWFHNCHSPVVAPPEFLDLYPGCTIEQQHYYGCISALDEQVGRLRAELRNLGIDQNTMLCFSSDNGPESVSINVRSKGETAGFRGRKRSLYEGGVRVPEMLEWPSQIKTRRVITMPCGTLDYFPTVLDVLGYQMPNKPDPIDGVSLKPLIEGTMTQRPMPIGFQHEGSNSELRALSDNQYKIISTNTGASYELYDLVNDPYETTNIASQNATRVNSMKVQLNAWIASCANSNSGGDY